MRGSDEVHVNLMVGIGRGHACIILRAAQC